MYRLVSEEVTEVLLLSSLLISCVYGKFDEQNTVISTVREQKLNSTFN